MTIQRFAKTTPLTESNLLLQTTMNQFLKARKRVEPIAWVQRTKHKQILKSKNAKVWRTTVDKQEASSEDQLKGMVLVEMNDIVDMKSTR